MPNNQENGQNNNQKKKGSHNRHRRQNFKKRQQDTENKIQSPAPDKEAVEAPKLEYGSVVTLDEKIEIEPDIYSVVGDELDRIIAAEEAAMAAKNFKIPDVIPDDKALIVGVRFNSGSKTYYFDPAGFPCKKGEGAVVETARGLEYGEVCIAPTLIDKSLIVPPLRPVVRIATAEDIRHNKENIQKEDEAFRIGLQKILDHKLDMKLVKAQYTFDNSKLLFYFTSAGRVDFRELVKDLAGVFHIRIELRQIGIRDEARMLGGLGTCGRPLCCSTFLSDFGQVSMKMAKEQNLSLNSTKISGCCGRLMCCLRYEYDVYAEEINNSPAVGSFVRTPDGNGVVTEIYPLAAEIKVSIKNDNDITFKRYKRDDVTVLTPARPQKSSDDDKDGEIEP